MGQEDGRINRLKEQRRLDRIRYVDNLMKNSDACPIPNYYKKMEYPFYVMIWRGKGNLIEYDVLSIRSRIKTVV